MRKSCSGLRSAPGFPEDLEPEREAENREEGEERGGERKKGWYGKALEWKKTSGKRRKWRPLGGSRKGPEIGGARGGAKSTETFPGGGAYVGTASN